MKRIENFEQATEAIGVVAKAYVQLEDLVKTQDTQIKTQDTQIKLLLALVDHHHQIFIDHGWATPRPKVDPRAN